jgi:hypothetical protein
MYYDAASIIYVSLYYNIMSFFREDAASTNKRQGGKKNVEKNIFSERVNKLNENIDQMASQLSSIGKDIENRVTSLNSSIQVLCDAYQIYFTYCL